MTPELGGMPFTLADIVIVLVIVVSGLLALYRGFFTEALAVAGWIGATVVTLTMFTSLQPYTRQVIPITIAADVVTGIVLFLVSLLVISIITHSLANIVRGKTVSWFDRVLGLLFGLLRGIVLLAFLYLLVIQIFPPDEHPAWVRQSQTLPLVRTTSDWMLKLVPQSLVDNNKRSEAI